MSSFEKKGEASFFDRTFEENPPLQNVHGLETPVLPNDTFMNISSPPTSFSSPHETCDEDNVFSFNASTDTTPECSISENSDSNSFR